MVGSEDQIVDDNERGKSGQPDEDCDQLDASPGISPGLFPHVRSQAIFRDGPVDLFETLPVLGRNRVVRQI